MLQQTLLDLHMLAAQVALAVPVASSTGGGATTSREVVLVVCDAARSQGIDIFRSWCQSTALAELDITIVLAADDDCSHVAREAGLHSTLYSSPKASLQEKEHFCCIRTGTGRLHSAW